MTELKPNLEQIMNGLIGEVRFGNTASVKDMITAYWNLKSLVDDRKCYPD